MTFYHKRSPIRPPSKFRLFMIFVASFVLFLNFGCQTLGFTNPQINQVSRSFQDMDDFKSWFVYYYETPKPEELTSAIIYMEKNGLLLEYPEVASMFISQIFISHPESAPLWIESWDKVLSERQWTVVIVALWLADNKEFNKIATAQLNHIPAEKSQKMTKMIHKMAPRALNPLYADINHIGQINMLWAGFSATGDKKYVDRVIDLISRFARPNKIQQKSLGEAALVSLAQNTLMHRSVEESVKKAEKNHPNPTTRALIQAMLQALAAVEKQELSLPKSPAH